MASLTRGTVADITNPSILSVAGRITDPKDSHILTSEAYGSMAWYGEGDSVDMIGLELERRAYLVRSPMVSKQQPTSAFRLYSKQGNGFSHSPRKGLGFSLGDLY